MDGGPNSPARPSIPDAGRGQDQVERLRLVATRWCFAASMLIGKPFTLQYAREQVGRDLWATPAFVRTNYVITAAWAVAFVVMVIADLVLIYMPDLPPRFGIIATVTAIVGAVKFTGWYPERGVSSCQTGA
jgi:hypothetical protein